MVTKTKRRLTWRVWLVYPILISAGFIIGRVVYSPGPVPPVIDPAAPVEQDTRWTCSMHPQIQLPDPGLCPICAMDLIPMTTMEDGEAEAHDHHITLSESAAKRIQLQTAPVERRFVENEIRLVGVVDFDESRVGQIAAWVPGRIDRMYADYTGIRVAEGDHMVDLYSPELIAAQEELIRSHKALRTLNESMPDSIRSSAQATVKAIRDKLLRWGLTQGQINALERSGTPRDTITIYAPLGGTVIERNGHEGMYVEQGTRLYAIADLTHVWVQMDAYESDLPWLRYGQHVDITTEAYPGEFFEGTIAFIAPTLDPVTRTVKVRVNLSNPDERLKPGMFVRATALSKMASKERVMEADLAGKWICPMHPEIVKDDKGTCDICHMDLVQPESLGYVVSNPQPDDMPLVIPATAPLITGKRAVVYVEVPGKESPTYEGREITLGTRAGAYYLVEAGLREGEQVVINGNFKLDSALQLQAKRSMMHPGDEKAESAVPEAFLLSFSEFYQAYLAVQDALAYDRFEEAKEKAVLARSAFKAIDAMPLKGDGKSLWQDKFSLAFAGSLNDFAASESIDAARTAFQPLSNTLLEAVKTYGLRDDLSAYHHYCSMAFDFEGALWLQADDAIRNPYFGDEMFRCGTVKEQLTGVSSEMNGSGTKGEGSHSKGEQP